MFKWLRSVFDREYSLPIMGSMVIHASLFALLFISWHTPSVINVPPPLYINANLVEVTKPKVSVSKADNRSRINAEKARKAEVARRKKAEQAALEKKAKALEEKKQLALKQKQEEDARKAAKLKQKALEQQKQLAEQLKRKQKELAEQLAKEYADQQQQQANEQAAKDAAAVAYYRNLIVNRMALNWSRPPSARNNMEALVSVELSPFGDLLGFKIIKSSGDTAFDRSVIQAIKLGTPITAMKNLNRRIFEKNFRQFTFKFSPEDLVK